MNYWVYKCNTKGTSVGNNNWGDWEEEDGMLGDAPFGWGRIGQVPDIEVLKTGDMVIAHQSDRARLVGVAEVVGFRNGELMLRPAELLQVNMRKLKKKYADVGRIPAYQGGPIRSIYEISTKDAENLLRRARNEAGVGAPAAGPTKVEAEGVESETGDTDLDEWAEGEERELFVKHRKREQKARRAKIALVLAKTGSLACEVPGCSFDFAESFGKVGEGFAHVHHLRPLSQARKGAKTRLEDLAVVCPNCHAMIHRGGKCRPLSTLRKA